MNEIDVPAKVYAQLLVVHEVFAVNFVNDAGFRSGFRLIVVDIVVIVAVFIARAVFL